MSQSTFRHVNALSMKYELLREIKHWKQSCNKCINDIISNVKSLRASRAEVKREIHEARARLEERLKELEECSEKQMAVIVEAEEEKLKTFVKKLADRQKRMEMTESVLKDNVIGFKLQRTIEEGKHQALAVREAMLEVNKYNMATAVDFKLKEPLYSITERLDSLGTVTLLASPGKQNRKKQHPKAAEQDTKLPDEELEVSLDILTTNGESRSASIENTMANDLEFVLEMGTKYGNSLKPFLDSIKDISLKFNNDQVAKNEFIKQSPMVRRRPKLIDCEQKPKSALRTQSAKTEEIKGQRIHTRPSKSAREDGRMAVEENLCLNDVDMSVYVPFEEQGPETKEVKRKRTTRTMAVRYHDFDFVKEITAELDTENDEELSNCVISSEGIITDITRLPSPGSQSTTSTSLSTVSYKPSSSLASGPVYKPSSELRKSSSFFNYFARFHTKKHPYETDLCRLTGIVALDNGQIVVSDINHLQIMLFGPDFSYLDSLVCPSPCGIGQVSENTVAVTLFHNRKVMEVKVHTIHLIRYKEFNIPCQESLFAVSYRNGRYFVLCFAGDIHVLDDDGRQIIVLKTGINAGEARHMDIDNEAKMIFVSGHDRVSCFAVTGEKLWQFTNSTYHKRFTPSGVVLHNNRVFVADWTSSKVLELTLEGSHLRDVVIDDIQHPHALAVQKSHGRLFITQSNYFKQEARSRSIKVFEIKVLDF